MSNNKAIQILRGTRAGIEANESVDLLQGQPIYNMTDNFLAIGDDNKDGCKVTKEPIAVKELYSSSDVKTIANSDGYYIYGDDTNALNIYSSKNEINLKGKGENVGVKAIIGDNSLTIKSQDESSYIKMDAVFGNPTIEGVGGPAILKLKANYGVTIYSQKSIAQKLAASFDESATNINSSSTNINSNTVNIGNNASGTTSIKSNTINFGTSDDSKNTINNTTDNTIIRSFVGGTKNTLSYIKVENEIISSANNSLVFGQENENYHSESFVSGHTNINKGWASTVLGQGNKNSANVSFVSGYLNKAYKGQKLAVFGVGNEIGTDDGTDDENVNDNTQATIISGQYNKIKNSSFSAVFGSGNTLTNANKSFVSGDNNEVKHQLSFAFGQGLVTSSNINIPQIVLGKYNHSNDNAYIIVGKGDGDDQRRNLFTLSDSQMTCSVSAFFDNSFTIGGNNPNSTFTLGTTNIAFDRFEHNIKGTYTTTPNIHIENLNFKIKDSVTIDSIKTDKLTSDNATITDKLAVNTIESSIDDTVAIDGNLVLNYNNISRVNEISTNTKISTPKISTTSTSSNVSEYKLQIQATCFEYLNSSDEIWMAMDANNIDWQGGNRILYIDSAKQCKVLYFSI